mgnify:CR=1 FL=1
MDEDDPGQRELVKAKEEGRTPDPKYGLMGRQRSVHNTYFTLPVLFTMISNHYAGLYGHEWNWVLLMMISVAGALIRVWFVQRDKGDPNPLVLAAGLVMLALTALLALPRPSSDGGGPVSFDQVLPIIQARCVSCHACYDAPCQLNLASYAGITRGASLVLAPKVEAPIRHIEFVSLSQDRSLVVLVFANGHVENRLFTPPPGHTPSSMREAANFLNALAEGKTLTDLRRGMSAEIALRRQEIDSLARELVESGLAVWENPGETSERLIVRGRANLLDEESTDINRIRTLFDDLERKRDITEFLELAETGEGVRIFIGSENKLFSLSGSSLVVSPYMNADRKIIGAVGVIGPTRLNYGRIVPIVDYTAQLVGRIMSERGT